MENFTKKEVEYSIAKARVQQLKKFYISLGIFLIVMAIYGFRKFYLYGDISLLTFRNMSIVFWIWGIILAIKAAKIFFFNQNWERKMMDKELNK